MAAFEILFTGKITDFRGVRVGRGGGGARGVSSPNTPPTRLFPQQFSCVVMRMAGESTRLRDP